MVGQQPVVGRQVEDRRLPPGRRQRRDSCERGRLVDVRVAEDVGDRTAWKRAARERQFVDGARRRSPPDFRRATPAASASSSSPTRSGRAAVGDPAQKAAGPAARRRAPWLPAGEPECPARSSHQARVERAIPPHGVLDRRACARIRIAPSPHRALTQPSSTFVANSRDMPSARSNDRNGTRRGPLADRAGRTPADDSALPARHRRPASLRGRP